MCIRDRGSRYISRYRSMAQNAVADIFGYVQNKFVNIQNETPELMKNT